MPQHCLRILQISVVQMILVAGLGMTQLAQARGECPGFQVYRGRSDHEAPVLPRSSIAAIAIQSPDGCDHSSEDQSQPPHQTSEPVRQSQQSLPTDEPVPALNQPVER